MDGFQAQQQRLCFEVEETFRRTESFQRRELRELHVFARVEMRIAHDCRNEWCSSARLLQQKIHSKTYITYHADITYHANIIIPFHS